MTGNPAGRSPLAPRASDLAGLARRVDGALAIAEIPLPAQVDLRMDPADAGHLPFDLPLEPNTVTEIGDRSLLWLGPDEWLIAAPTGSAQQIAAELDVALDGLHRSVVDVSANRAVLELRGPRARDLLSKGCGLDLHPRAWRPGMCAQTLLARVQVLLHQREDATRVLVRPSFGDSLVDWLLDGAAEYATGQPPS